MSNQRKSYNICMVSDFFFPGFGGVESHIYNLAQCLLKRGHKVIVITRAHESKNKRVGIRYMSNGLKVYYIPIFVVMTPPGETTLPFLISNFPYYRNIFIREKIEIVHGHQSTSNMSNEAMFHASIMGLKTVFTDHSLFGFGDGPGIHINKVMKFVLSFVNHAISVSHTSRVNTVLRSGVAPQKVSVIPNAVDTDLFRPSNAPLVRKDNTITIVIVQRMVYRKGVTLLKELIPLICEKYKNVRFIIRGGGVEKYVLEQMIEQHRLQDRVDMKDAVKSHQVRDVLIQGDIFLSCSLTEAFGISIIEAASCGLLVVATRVGGVPEILPEDMLRLAEPNVASLFRVLSRTIDNFDFKVDNRKKFHDFVASVYNWDVVCSKVLNVYHRVAQMKPISIYEMMVNGYQTGLVYGKIVCCIMAIDLIFYQILEWLFPREEIDIAIDFPKPKQE